MKYPKKSIYIYCVYFSIYIIEVRYCCDVYSWSSSVVCGFFISWVCFVFGNQPCQQTLATCLYVSMDGDGKSVEIDVVWFSYGGTRCTCSALGQNYKARLFLTFGQCALLSASKICVAGHELIGVAPWAMMLNSLPMDQLEHAAR